MLHLGNELVLGNLAFPVVGRVQVHEEFLVKEARGVGTVVGAAGLRNHAPYFRKFLEHLPELLGVVVRIFQADAQRHRGPHVNRAFVEVGQKLGAHEVKCTYAQHQRHQGRGHGAAWVGHYLIKQRRVGAVQELNERVVPLAHVLVQQNRREHRHQREGQQQGPQQRKADGESQGTEQLALHFLEGENRDKRRDDDELGGEDGLAHLQARAQDTAQLRPLVEALHALVLGPQSQHHKQALHHHHGPVDDDAKVDGADGQQVGRHALHAHQNEGEQQGQRNYQRHRDGGAPVGQKEQQHNGNEQNAHGHVLAHRVQGVLVELRTVIEYLDFGILRQDGGIELLYLGFEHGQHGAGVFALAHQHNAFHHVVVGVAAHHAQRRQRAGLHRADVAHEHGHAIHVFDDDFFNVGHAGYDADAAHHEGLLALAQHVAAHVHVGLLQGRVHVERREAVLAEQAGVHGHFKRAHLAAKTHHVGHASHGPQILLNHPVLQGFEVRHGAGLGGEGVAVNFAGGAGGGLHAGGHAVGQVHVGQLLGRFHAGVEVVGAVLKHDFDEREPEQANRANHRFVGDGVHFRLDGHGNKALHFLGRAARPLRDNHHLGVGHVGVGLHGRVVERHGARHCH